MATLRRTTQTNDRTREFQARRLARQHAQQPQQAQQGRKGFEASSLIQEGGALAGATTGAAIGTAILPGIGTIAGSGIGAFIGSLTGGTVESKVRDNKFDVGGNLKEAAVTVY